MSFGLFSLIKSIPKIRHSSLLQVLLHQSHSCNSHSYLFFIFSMYNDIYVNFSTNDKLIPIKLLINTDICPFMFLTCSSAATMYMANTGKTAPFIVMETDILSSGMPSNNICQIRVQYQITSLKSLNFFTFSAILDRLMH